VQAFSSASLLFFFYHPPSFFSPGKVAIHSGLERKINRLVIHRNVNATLVPLGTSVCVAWDHSGLSARLWTCDKWPRCLSIFNTYTLCQICPLYLHTCFHIYVKANTHKSTLPSYRSLLTCPHALSTVDLSCVMETGVRYCVMCVGVISLGKRTKDLTEVERGPTITAWNITAVKEPLHWQEESWAPVSDSTDQKLFSGQTQRWAG